MNREIKFRAWDKDNNTMSQPFKLMHSQELYTGQHEVMQYTGLEDKNGTPVYEGDIIRIDGWDEPREWRWVVEWIKKDARFEPRGESLVECEVIGNIYENPELINKE